MKFKAYCQRTVEDSIAVESMDDEIYLRCDAANEFCAIILNKKDALALASTIINHYKVEQRGS